MDHHIADIERVREAVGVTRWVVLGVSWGSVLGVTYAERHPERVLAVVVGAVSTGTAADIEWLTVHAGRFFPREWEVFRDHVPLHRRRLSLADA
jgi:proline iminopeptidase